MKTTNTFSVQFVIRTKKNDHRTAIIYVRINANKKRLEISLKKSTDPVSWDAPAESVKRYKASDIFLSELNYQFITEFEFFLRRTVPLDASNPLTNNVIMKHIERLRKMVTLATKMEWIPKDPFIRYRLRFQKTEREFLN